MDFASSLASIATSPTRCDEFRSPAIETVHGRWIKTDQNVTTMEGANEGGRYAANGVLQASGYNGDMVKIVELFQAPWWIPFKQPDKARYRSRLPHILDILDTRWPR